MRVNLSHRRQRPDAGRQELTFLSVDTRTPYAARFSDEDGGETAHYMLRWLGTAGEKG
jgi:hypothetical protein